MISYLAEVSLLQLVRGIISICFGFEIIEFFLLSFVQTKLMKENFMLFLVVVITRIYQDFIFNITNQPIFVL